MFGSYNAVAKQENSENKITATNFGLNINTVGSLFTVGVYYTFEKAAE